MKLEIMSASNFLAHLVRLGRRNVSENQLTKFRDELMTVLRRRYKDHWFPEKPFKGSGYRCIRINGKMDPIIGQAGEAVGLSSTFLHQTFPSELTMWIDPLEVSYRIGENGSICVLYEFNEVVPEAWKPSQNLNKHSASQNQNANKIALTTAPIINRNESVEPTSTPSCKESMRSMTYLLDPRKSVSIEHLAAYVSS